MEFFDSNLRVFAFLSFVMILIIFVLFTIFIGILLFICVLTCIYYVIQYLQIDFENTSVFLYRYGKYSQTVLNMYGDYKIERIYLIRQPLHWAFYLSKFLFIKEKKDGKDEKDGKDGKDDISKLQDDSVIAYHTALVFEIRLPSGQNKFVLVEKNNSMRITDKFYIYNNYEIKKLHIKKNRHTLNSILQEAQKNMGAEKFFNWNLFNNNCSNLIKEILIILGNNTKKNTQFILQTNEETLNKYEVTVFTKYLIHLSCSTYSFFDKYVWSLF